MDTNGKDICPVSGLERVSRPEWTFVGKEGDFKVKTTLVDKNIFHLQVEGRVYYEDQVNSIQLFNDIVAQSIGENESFVQIQDWKGFKSASDDARQLYIDFLKSNDRIKGVIFCNVTFMFRMTRSNGMSARDSALNPSRSAAHSR